MVNEMVAKSEAPATGEVKIKKPRGAQGPRPLFLLFKVVDENGNEIEGAKVEVAAASRNANKVLSTLSGDRTLTYSTIAVE